MAKVINPTGGGSGGYFPSVKFYNNTLDANSSVSMVGQGKTYNGVWKVDKQGHNLPSEYQEVEYIQSTGTQYIDTEIKGSSDVGTLAKIGITSSTDQNYAGSYNSSTVRFYPIYEYDSTKLRIGWNSLTDISNPILLNENIFETNFMGSNVAKLNGTIVSNLSGTFNNNTNIYLFGVNGNGIPALKSRKIFSFKMSVGTTLIRDYIPCYRKSDSVIGLYDLVTETFYTNSGSGTFLMGRPIDSLPDGYDEVEYIESSGTQYIDTNLLAYDNFDYLEIQNQLINTSPQYQTLIGAFSTNMLSSLRYNSGSMYGIIGNSVSNSFSYDTSKHTLSASLTSSSMQVFLDGTSKFTISGALSTHNIYLFAVNAQGTPNQYGYYKIFNCILKLNGTLVRNFVPCYRKTDGEIGLYDIVNNQFYSNDGTGTFKKGKVIGGYFDIDKVKDLGTYTWTATQGGFSYSRTLQIIEPIRYEVFLIPSVTIQQSLWNVGYRTQKARDVCTYSVTDGLIDLKIVDNNAYNGDNSSAFAIYSPLIDFSGINTIKLEYTKTSKSSSSLKIGICKTQTLSNQPSGNYSDAVLYGTYYVSATILDNTYEIDVSSWTDIGYLMLWSANFNDDSSTGTIEGKFTSVSLE